MDENTPQTVQTGQAITRAYFEIARARGTLKWHWALWRGDGKPLALDTHGYPSREDAIRGAEEVNALLRQKIPIVQAAQ